MRRLPLLLFLLWGFALMAQSPAGVWKTIHERTGKEKSYVKIFASDGKFYGKIVEVLEADYLSVCRKCEGDKHNQPIEGLVIIEDVETTQSRGKWSGGTVLDPEMGRTFSFSMWFEKGNTDELKVRGQHWTGIYRTQTWQRAPEYTQD